MTVPERNARFAALMRNDGVHLLSATEAIVKGVLESELTVTTLATPGATPFSGMARMVRDEAAAGLLAEHGTQVQITPDARRGIAVAGFAARSGQCAVALVPNREVDATMHLLEEVRRRTFPPGGGLCVMLEDDPAGSPATCPRQAAWRLGLACLEPNGIGQLRDVIETALRLSRADRAAVGVVVHRSILRSMDTIMCRPNRMRGSAVDVLTAGRRVRRRRISEAGGLLRVARRLELNAANCLPSPGERVTVGFVVVGPADPSLRHLVHVLRLTGRVPVLQLALLNPVDEVAVGRLLTRCEQVVVLEPRPGVVESAVLRVAESLRHGGERPGAVWGRQLPPGPSGEAVVMTGDGDLNPSILARRIVHLLHSASPRAQVASRLMPEPPAVPVSPPPRGRGIGTRAAVAAVRGMLGDLQQWLDEREPTDEEEVIEPRALAVDGVMPAEADAAARTAVCVEVWQSHRFREEGLAALQHAARAARPWMLIVCALSADEADAIERLARASVPSGRADAVRIRLATLDERTALRDEFREAATGDGLTVLLVTEGATAQFDITTIERDLAEIDRLGFAPTQRRIWPTDVACEIRPALEPDGAPGRSEQVLATMQTRYSIDRLPRHTPRKLGVRVRPLLEQVQVTRTRAPSWIWRGQVSSMRLAPPTPLHSRAPQWRAHLAAYRGDAPGFAAQVLCDAGRAMGYTVRCAYDSTPVRPGYRASAQVLFTRPRREGPGTPLIATVPYGEADLLLGADADEALRAVGPDPALRVAQRERTGAVINVDAPATDADPDADAGADRRAAYTAAFEAVTRDEPRVLEDFATACRAWLQTDRVTDLAMLGCAFQSGLVPLTLQSLERALARLEALGVGRAREAFEFGRHLAVSEHLFRRTRTGPVERVDRLRRRLVHELARTRGFGAGAAARLDGLLSRCLAAMPGLAETDRGRAAERDFVVALNGCLFWGGFDYAERYADLIMALYRADRGDRGRAVTREAILPLAEAMLIRDPIYIATMLVSLQHRRLTRQQLDAKHARGDTVERRYLTRLELRGFKRRMRLNIRTGAWGAYSAAALWRIVPERLRGGPRERELRRRMIDLVQQATRGLGADYRHWSRTFTDLHDLARRGRLRSMSAEDLDALAARREDAAAAASPAATPATAELD